MKRIKFETYSSASNNEIIKYNRLLPKLCNCLPIVGNIIHFMANFNLNRQLVANGDVPDIKVRILQVRNHYRVGAIVRHILFIAIAATALALLILTKVGNPLSYGLLAVIITMIAFTALKNIVHFDHDKRLIRSFSH